LHNGIEAWAVLGLRNPLSRTTAARTVIVLLKFHPSVHARSAILLRMSSLAEPFRPGRDETEVADEASVTQPAWLEIPTTRGRGFPAFQSSCAY
jgi:hypothetical protein